VSELEVGVTSQLSDPKAALPSANVPCEFKKRVLPSSLVSVALTVTRKQCGRIIRG